jgi:hypothetical protein
VELELKAGPGCVWGEREIHLWHLVPAHGDTALCDLLLDRDEATRPARRRAGVFPERLCPVCRRRCAELLPIGDPVGTVPR